jgi:AraC-like DNA-binding protein
VHNIEAGSFFLHDNSFCSELRLLGDFKALTLTVPRKLVNRCFARPQHLCALPLSVAHSAVGRVAADLLQSIARNSCQMEGEAVESVIESLLQLVALAFGLSPLRSAGSTVSHSTLLIRIRNYIHAHLDDETLSPKTIAAAHAISERYVNKLFEREDTTVSKWIWEQRLQASQRALSLAEFSCRKISEIAYGVGFNNVSHFSFSFRKRFGCTPREYRRRELLAHAKALSQGRLDPRPMGGSADDL